jgi:hypothetical protein
MARPGYNNTVKLHVNTDFIVTGDDEGNVWGWFLRMATEEDMGSGDDYGVVSYRLEE